MSANEAFNKAKKINETLKADDPRFYRSVEMIHEEGTFMFLRYSFVETYDEWVFIFSEHHGFFVYHEDDISWNQYEEIHK